MHHPVGTGQFYLSITLSLCSSLSLSMRKPARSTPSALASLRELKTGLAPPAPTPSTPPNRLPRGRGRWRRRTRTLCLLVACFRWFTRRDSDASSAHAIWQTSTSPLFLVCCMRFRHGLFPHTHAARPGGESVGLFQDAFGYLLLAALRMCAAGGGSGDRASGSGVCAGESVQDIVYG